MSAPASSGPGNTGAGPLLCFEGWYDSQGKIQTRSDKVSFNNAVHWFETGRENIPDLRQTGSISPSFRVISCPISTQGPFSFGIPSNLWPKIERKLNLHPSTSFAIVDNNGVYSKFLSSDREGPGQNTIWIIVKFPNCVNIGYDAVSICYSTRQNAVTVLYHGLRDEETVFEVLHANIHLCFHPMFFPVAIYCSHQLQLGRYRDIVDSNIFDLEDEIGYAVPGRLEYRGRKSRPGQRRPAIDYEQSVRRLQSYQTELATIGHVARFSQSCGEFLLQSIEQFRNDILVKSNSSLHAAAGENILHRVEFSRSLTVNLLSQCQALKERVQSQVNLIFNLIAQDESRTNYAMAERTAEIAISSKRDSTAMKAIALISVIFLPATFVSTFLSMDMFDWTADSGSLKVSSYIWIWFAITIPLTICLVLIWNIWWKKRTAQYDIELRKENSKPGPKESLQIHSGEEVESTPATGKSPKFSKAAAFVRGLSWKVLRSPARSQEANKTHHTC